MDGITDSMGMGFGELLELVMDREAWHAAGVHGLTKSWTWLSNWTEMIHLFLLATLKNLFLWEKHFMNKIIIIIDEMPLLFFKTCLQGAFFHSFSLSWESDLNSRLHFLINFLWLPRWIVTNHMFSMFIEIITSSLPPSLPTFLQLSYRDRRNVILHFTWLNILKRKTLYKSRTM